jgi:hypothetical protein
LLGVAVLSQGLQGYIYRVGDVTNLGALQWPIRVLLVLGAGMFAMPGNDIVGMTNTELLIAGAIVTAAAVALAMFGKRLKPAV